MVSQSIILSIEDFSSSLMETGKLGILRHCKSSWSCSYLLDLK